MISTFLLLSNFLKIIPSGLLRSVDIELLICVPLLVYCYLINKNIFNTRKDKIGKIIKLLLVYYFIFGLEPIELSSINKNKIWQTIKTQR